MTVASLTDHFVSFFLGDYTGKKMDYKVCVFMTSVDDKVLLVMYFKFLHLYFAFDRKCYPVLLEK
jgi:hypothetical protein